MLITKGNILMFKIGLSSCNKPLCEDLFRQYKAAGITLMEISPRANDFPSLNYDILATLGKQYSITFNSLHIPFSPFSEIDPSNKKLAEYTFEYFSAIMEKASVTGVDKFIIHPSGEPIDDSERADRMECAINTLAKLSKVAQKYNAIVAVENLPRTCLGKNSDEILQLISGDDQLRVCFDTNHLLDEDPVEFIHKIGNKIITTHVSDYDYVNERHWLPGEGKTDWQALIKALRDVNYNGPWLYEMGFKAPNSLVRDRNLTCEDFVRNANELFEGKIPTVIGKPIENLGFWA